MSTTTGILTIAVGPATYKNLAVNLAMNLKASVPGIPVALVTDKKDDFCQEDLPIFDELIITKETNPFKIKANLYTYTPFSKTLYIDADSLWNTQHSLQGFLDMLSAFELGHVILKEIGYKDREKIKPEWVSLSELWNHYKWSEEAKYQAVQSSLIYFKRCKRVREYFKAVAKAYGTIPNCGTIRGLAPDEPVFSYVLTASVGTPDVSLRSYLYAVQGPQWNRSMALKANVITFPGLQHSSDQRQFYKAVANQGWSVYGRGYDLRK